MKDNDDNLFHVYAYDGPEMPKDENDIGHYMAICYRGGTWVLYDDFEEKEKRIKNNSIIKPKLIFYVKVE